MSATTLDDIVREHWYAAVATVCRLTGDLAAAEDAVQEACAAAVVRWPADGVPANPIGWLVGVARHKALDRLRREAVRGEKEAAAMSDHRAAEVDDYTAGVVGDDMLGLIFLCCHPALERATQIALTLRSVCGLSTTEIAAAFLVPEPTMAKRLVRAKAKIRDSQIPFRTPAARELPRRLAGVLRVIYVLFTEGHMTSRGTAPIRADLCDTAIRLARALAGLLPEEPEARGLVALLLLIDARRDARIDENGDMVLLGDQDRRRWNWAMIAEGKSELDLALNARRPGPYQLHAAVAACHSVATGDATDWREIALLYAELVRYEPTPIIEANRAVAVAMSEGPAAGLVVLDALAHDPRLRMWPQFHIARGELLLRLDRRDDAARTFCQALELEPGHASRALLVRRLSELSERAGSE